MAAGIKALRKIQIGKESSIGTPVAATVRLVGKMSMKVDQKLFMPDDQDNESLASFVRTPYPVGLLAQMTFEADVNFEQVMYLLNMAIKGGVTPSGAGPYVWTWTPNYDASNAPDFYTIQFGDNVQAFRATSCIIQSLQISGQVDDVWKVKAEFFGQTVATNAFTSLSAVTALEPAIVNKSKLYVDTTWAGIGGTQLSATLADFSWKIDTGFRPMKYADGGLVYTEYSEKKRHVELDSTWAFNSTVAGKYAAYLAQTNQFIRIEATGSAISGGNKKMSLDMSGPIVDWPSLDEREGQDIVKIKAKSIYIATGTRDMQVVVTNSVAALV